MNIPRTGDIIWIGVRPSIEQDNEMSIGRDVKTSTGRDIKAATRRWDKIVDIGKQDDKVIKRGQDNNAGNFKVAKENKITKW